METMSTNVTTQTKSARQSGDESSREKMASRVTASAFIWLTLFILGLAILLWISGSGMADLMWTRYIYLLTGVETVAFAALGWLFGREVHRQQVNDANQRAENSLLEERAAKEKMMQVMQHQQSMQEKQQENSLLEERATKKEMMQVMQQAMQEKQQAMSTLQQVMGTMQQTTPRASDGVFIHTATGSNFDNNYPHCTFIDSPYTNNNPNAILLVTQNWIADSRIYNDHNIGVWYNTDPGEWSGKWSIFNEDRAPMPLKAAFNVMVMGSSSI
jgi:hypothetical protein